MSSKHEHALAGLCALLARTHFCNEHLRQQLTSIHPEVAVAAATEVITALATPPMVLVQMDPEGGDPDLWADKPVDAALLRFGSDLRHLDKEDIFRIQDQFEAGSQMEVAGFRVYPVPAAHFVRRTFDAIDFHKVERAVQVEIAKPEIMARRFRIDWVQGYGEKEAETHPIAWFTTDLGFEHDTIRALAALEVGQTHEEFGPVEKVTITRTE